MRGIIVCAALCVVLPGPLAAGWEPAPAEIAFTRQASFAYAARHDIGALPETAIEAMHPGEHVSVDLREEAEPVRIAPDKTVPRAPSREALCHAVAAVAAANDLPVPFFANLIQQESSFRTHVVSPVGAQGIAQFMPRTARAYGLDNPFDPLHAIAVSGRFLSELLAQFGNLGLAAAAYNAGSGRVLNWVQNRGRLPEETQNYVSRVTGLPAIRWARPGADDEATLPVHARCPELELGEAVAVAMAQPAVAVALAAPATRSRAARSSRNTNAGRGAGAAAATPVPKPVERRQAAAATPVADVSSRVTVATAR